MVEEFTRVLVKNNFSAERAALCARLFAESSRDGVYTHGLNRFPRFIRYIRKGLIDVNAVPEVRQSLGNFERWDGKLGPGNLNAYAAMARAIELAKEHGMGCVSLANTNHWMRGGSYGWQAVDAGCLSISWTNTIANLPPWGSKEALVGNNPLILAVPRKEGSVVLDMAMTQFSYGKMEQAVLRKEDLPMDGGFDADGKLTKNPRAILASRRPLAIGYWKGTGLALALDLVVTLLSGGKSTREVSKADEESGMSQIFICFDPHKFEDYEDRAAEVERVIAEILGASPGKLGEAVHYPGDRTLKTRQENIEKGIPVDEPLWKEVLAL